MTSAVLRGTVDTPVSPSRNLIEMARGAVQRFGMLLEPLFVNGACLATYGAWSLLAFDSYAAAHFTPHDLIAQDSESEAFRVAVAHFPSALIC